MQSLYRVASGHGRWKAEQSDIWFYDLEWKISPACSLFFVYEIPKWVSHLQGDGETEFDYIPPIPRVHKVKHIIDCLVLTLVFGSDFQWARVERWMRRDGIRVRRSSSSTHWNSFNSWELETCDFRGSCFSKQRFLIRTLPPSLSDSLGRYGGVECRLSRNFP